MSVNVWYNANPTNAPLSNTNAKFNSLVTPTGIIDALTVTTINGVIPSPPAPPPTAAVGSVLTVVAPSTMGFTRDADLDNVNIDVDLQFNGNSGVASQVVKKVTPTTQDWQNLVAADITPGLAKQNFVTNSSATAAIWSNDVAVNGSLSFGGIDGTAGQIVKKESGTQIWSNDLGDKNADSITFNTAGSTPLSSYELLDSGLSSTLNLVYEDGIGTTVGCVFTKIGNVVSMHIPEISYTFTKGASAINNYRFIFAIPTRFRPLYGTSPNPTTSPFLMDCFSTCISCSQQDITAGSGIQYLSGAVYVSSFGNVYIYTSSNRGVVPLTNGNQYSFISSACTLTWSIE